jgi:hypothetical protein
MTADWDRTRSPRADIVHHQPTFPLRRGGPRSRIGLVGTRPFGTRAAPLIAGEPFRIHQHLEEAWTIYAGKDQHIAGIYRHPLGLLPPAPSHRLFGAGRRLQDRGRGQEGGGDGHAGAGHHGSRCAFGSAPVLPEGRGRRGETGAGYRGLRGGGPLQQGRAERGALAPHPAGREQRGVSQPVEARQPGFHGGLLLEAAHGLRPASRARGRSDLPLRLSYRPALAHAGARSTG